MPAANRKVFWELFENQKTGWVQQFFRRQQITIEPEAVALLLELVENNTRQLEIVCSQLALYYGEGARIGALDIEQTLSHSKEENVFTLFDRLVLRDLEAGLEVLQKILLSRSDDSDPVQLLGGLLFQFRRLMALHRLLAERYSAEEAFAKLSLRSKRAAEELPGGHPPLHPAGAASTSCGSSASSTCGCAPPARRWRPSS